MQIFSKIHKLSLCSYRLQIIQDGAVAIVAIYNLVQILVVFDPLWYPGWWSIAVQALGNFLVGKCLLQLQAVEKLPYSGV